MGEGQWVWQWDGLRANIKYIHYHRTLHKETGDTDFLTVQKQCFFQVLNCTSHVYEFFFLFYLWLKALELKQHWAELEGQKKGTLVCVTLVSMNEKDWVFV